MIIFQSVIKGLSGAAVLLAVYFIIVGLISGWQFTVNQFSQFWYFIGALTVGFGIQIGLYAYLKNAIHRSAPKGVVAVSGTTSTIAMVSCCSHYLANIIPLIGVSGAAALVGQYQIELFWFGLAANATGIGYIATSFQNNEISSL